MLLAVYTFVYDKIHVQQGYALVYSYMFFPITFLPYKIKALKQGNPDNSQPLLRLLAVRV